MLGTDYSKLYLCTSIFFLKWYFDILFHENVPLRLLLLTCEWGLATGKIAFLIFLKIIFRCTDFLKAYMYVTHIFSIIKYTIGKHGN